MVVDVTTLHLDAKLWGPENTEEFHPLRFAPERKRNPLAFMPFGNGPRICLGMRFAMLEIKMVLIKLLRGFALTKSPTMPKLKYTEGFIRRSVPGVSVLIN